MTKDEQMEFTVIELPSQGAIIRGKYYYNLKIYFLK